MISHTRVVPTALAAASVAIALGCSDSTSPVQQRDVPTSVHVAATNTMLASGGTTTLTAEVRGRNGDVMPFTPVTWSTTDANAVTVDAATGVATAVAQGSAWIVAASDQARDSVQVMVDYVKISGPQPFVSITNFLQFFGQIGDGCALTAAGAAYCWGSNSYGQLGDGSERGMNSATPVAVAGGLTFSDVQAGYQAACGLTKGEGALYCWGLNAKAQFGTGSRDTQMSSVPLLGPQSLRFSDFSLGNDAAVCAISKDDGVLYCWGNETYWATGKDTVDVFTDSIVAPVAGNLEAAQVSVSDTEACAVGADAAVWCWGSNSGGYGLLNGGSGSRVPVQVVPAGTLASVTTTEGGTCGLTSGGQALCWGFPPIAPGASTAPPVAVPTPVAGALRFRKLVGSFYGYICGLTLGGDVYCWGNNEAYGGVGYLLGRPGVGSPAMRPASDPVQVLAGRKFVDVDEACAVDVAGDIYCWRHR